jgi:hypothetical protein
MEFPFRVRNLQPRSLARIVAGSVRWLITLPSNRRGVGGASRGDNVKTACISNDNGQVLCDRASPGEAAGIDRKQFLEFDARSGGAVLNVARPFRPVRPLGYGRRGGNRIKPLSFKAPSLQLPAPVLTDSRFKLVGGRAQHVGSIFARLSAERRVHDRRNALEV